MITGLANCGKTFKLEPLEYTFPVFSNQANEKYAWVPAELAEKTEIQSF